MVHCCQAHFDMGEIHENRLLVLTGVLKKLGVSPNVISIRLAVFVIPIP